METTSHAPGTPDDPYCGGQSCANEVSRAVRLLSGRWSVPVLEALCMAPGSVSRFRELQRRIPGISQKELTRQLSMLVNVGVARRESDLNNTRRVHYQLTPRGHALLKHMDELGQWIKASNTPISVRSEPPALHPLQAAWQRPPGTS
ncbi:MAG: transcriptional regulator [Rubrivivax sp.]|nr:MAG: transcriptional regulator [Rubrivivax sp.]